MADFNKAFPSKYLKASDLDGKQIACTVERVEFEKVGQNGDHKFVAYMRNASKGIVLNKTNCNMLAKITGSSDTDQWPGARVMVYVAEVEYQGEPMQALRLKPASTRPTPIAPPPAVREEPEPGSFDGGSDEEPF